MIANLEINCPQIEIDLQPYIFLRFVQFNNREESHFCEFDETDILFLVQHQDENEIGLMVCKTYSWRKNGDDDY
jgi:hypothetical protein